MAITTRSIIRGPAKVALGATTIYTLGDVTVTEGFDVLPFQTHRGRVRLVQNRWAKVSFTPNGYITTGIVGVLYPYLKTQANATGFRRYGESILPALASEIECVVTPTGVGRIYAYKNAIVKKMPDFIASATKTCFGPCEIMCYGTSYSGTASAANSIFGTGNGTDSTLDTGSTGVNPTLQPYTATWARTPSTVIETQAGWTVSFNLEFIEEPSDGYAIGDILAGNVDITATCDAHQFIETNSASGETIINAEFALDKAIGSDWSDKAYDLTIAARATAIIPITLALESMKLSEKTPVFSAGRQRWVGLTFTNSDAIASGVASIAAEFSGIS